MHRWPFITRKPDPVLLVLLASVIVAAAAVALALAGSRAPGAAAPASRAGPPPLENLPARPEALAQQELAPLTREQARVRNAAVDFAEGHLVVARPFRFAGGPLDRARATDCLAIAALAEAGASDEGQRAVIQVVLNRTRHPAFGRAICATVFQGSERATGCQFTFTCDGALQRRYSESAWEAARRRAQEALDGLVYAPVGLATHYHTDWVYPYWSPELDKIARVDTHLFFRWPGYWGSREAARVPYRGSEPAVAALADLPSHAAALTEGGTAAAELAADGSLGRGGGAASEVVMRHPGGGAFLVHLGSATSADAALTLGRSLCGADGYCQVMGWIERESVPSALPIPTPARAKLTFSYVLDAAQREIVFYDCRHFTGIPQDKCMPRALGS